MFVYTRATVPSEMPDHAICYRIVWTWEASFPGVKHYKKQPPPTDRSNLSWHMCRNQQQAYQLFGQLLLLRMLSMQLPDRKLTGSWYSHLSERCQSSLMDLKLITAAITDFLFHFLFHKYKVMRP